jgi:hypothetical protein
MSCLGKFLNNSARVYSVDKSETTISGQPIENLTLRTTIKCYFSPHVRNTWKLFTPGQIQVGEFVCYSIKTVNDGEVLTIDGTRYLVEASNRLQAGSNPHIFGYQIYLSRYKH